MRNLLFFSFIFLIVSTNKAKGCGFDYDPNANYYNLFDQSLISDKSLCLMLLDYSEPYYYAKGLEDLDIFKRNLASWQKHLKTTDPSLSVLLYQASLKTMRQMLGSKLSFDSTGTYWQNSSLVKAWRKGKNLDFYHYLIFAKTCEPHAEAYNSYWSEREVDTNVQAGLARQALQLAAAEEDPFLKERYWFHAVRMFHYAGHYQKAINTFENQFAKNSQSYIFYRAMEQAAGAYHALDSPKAPYYFSVVFGALPDRNEVCLASFKIGNQNLWDSAFALCQNKQEQANFHAMRAFQQGGLDIEEMELIYSLDKKSRYLELLAARQINRYERYFNPEGQNKFEDNYGDFFDRDTNEMEAYLKRFEKLLVKLSKSTNRNKTYFKLALSQVYVFKGRYRDVLKLLNKNKRLKGPLKAQAQVVHFQARLKLLDTLTDSNLSALENEYNSTPALAQHPQLRAYMLNSIYGPLFNKQQDTVRYFLCYNRVGALEYRIDLPLIKQLQKYYKANSASPLDEYLKQGVSTAQNQLNFYQGKYHFLRNQLDSAIYYFGLNPKEYYPVYNADAGMPDRSYPQIGRSIYNTCPTYAVKSSPFLKQTDSLSLNIKGLKTNYTILSLAQEMRNLEHRAKRNPDSAALYYLMLANAWVNMGGQGWYRMLHSEQGSYYTRNTSTWAPAFEFRYFTSKELYYYNPGIALNYVETALDLNPPNELKAKLAYVAQQALLEQGVQEEAGFYTITVTKTDYDELLLLDLAETSYAKQVIKACEWLSPIERN